MSSQADLPVPFGPSSAADPYPDYARLRTDGGIRRVTIRPGLEPWLFTRYDDIQAVLGSGWMSNDPANTSREVRQAIAAGCAEERVVLLGKNLLSVDPPDHTRMRRLISRTFSARRMAAMEEPVTVLTEQLLDALDGQEEADLLADYTLPLAVSVICHLIGIPESDHSLLCSWGRALVRADLDDAGAFKAVSDEMAKYFVPFILAKQDRPGDDLTSILVTARDGERLDDRELISLVYQLFFAGYESSAYFMSNAALLLLTHPDQRATLAANPGMLPAAIEEMLRFESPVKVPSWRFATHPVPIGDVVIAPGEPVLALLASGGRDEARYRAPDQFLIDRADTGHLAFGYGIHHCIGAALARMESRIAISQLFARFPEIQLARPVAALRWRVNLVMRGVCELPVRLHMASSDQPACSGGERPSRVDEGAAVPLKQGDRKPRPRGAARGRCAVDTDDSPMYRAMYFDRPHEPQPTVLDLIAANSAVRDLKAWALKRLEPGPGERALDVGCGTGEDVRVLAAMVGPYGEARGVEPNAGLLLEAQHRAAAVGAELLVDGGDAYQLPYDDASFDLVRSERVFQHLHEPERAVAEIARVLRPGGRVTVIDTDWGSTVLYPGDPQVVRRVLTSFTDALPNGRSGRRLRALLTEAGLHVDDMHATTWVERPENWLYTPVPFMPSVAAEAAILTLDEAERLQDQFASAAEAGTLHFSVTMFGAYARRSARG